jgi:hypothetical protein
MIWKFLVATSPLAKNQIRPKDIIEDIIKSRIPKIIMTIASIKIQVINPNLLTTNFTRLFHSNSIPKSFIKTLVLYKSNETPIEERIRLRTKITSIS